MSKGGYSESNQKKHPLTYPLTRFVGERGDIQEWGNRGFKGSQLPPNWSPLCEWWDIRSQLAHDYPIAYICIYIYILYVYIAFLPGDIHRSIIQSPYQPPQIDLNKRWQDYPMNITWLSHEYPIRTAGNCRRLQAKTPPVMTCWCWVPV